jgi:hypothetical protein
MIIGLEKAIMTFPVREIDSIVAFGGIGNLFSDFLSASFFFASKRTYHPVHVLLTPELLCNYSISYCYCDYGALT